MTSEGIDLKIHDLFINKIYLAKITQKIMLAILIF